MDLAIGEFVLLCSRLLANLSPQTINPRCYTIALFPRQDPEPIPIPIPCTDADDYGDLALSYELPFLGGLGGNHAASLSKAMHAAKSSPNLRQAWERAL
jgi:hypothetical protein